jgi:Flp pilus assembly protein TadD
MAAGAGFGWVVTVLRRHSLAVRLLPRVLVVLVLAVLTGLTIARNSVWGDAVTLWRDAVAKAPHWQTYAALGDALVETEGCGEAIPAYESAVRLAPRRLLPYDKLQQCLVAAGRLTEAEQVRTRMRELDPDATKLCREIHDLAPYLGRFEDCVARHRSAA